MYDLCVGNVQIEFDWTMCIFCSNFFCWRRKSVLVPVEADTIPSIYSFFLLLLFFVSIWPSFISLLSPSRSRHMTSENEGKIQAHIYLTSHQLKLAKSKNTVNLFRKMNNYYYTYAPFQIYTHIFSFLSIHKNLKCFSNFNR